MRAATQNSPLLIIAIRRYISIHAAHAGSDYTEIVRSMFGVVFQSTLPMRAATQINRIILSVILFQSTLPMRAATE